VGVLHRHCWGLLLKACLAAGARQPVTGRQHQAQPAAGATGRVRPASLQAPRCTRAGGARCPSPARRVRRARLQQQLRVVRERRVRRRARAHVPVRAQEPPRVLRLGAALPLRAHRQHLPASPTEAWPRWADLGLEPEPSPSACTACTLRPRPPRRASRSTRARPRGARRQRVPPRRAPHHLQPFSHKGAAQADAAPHGNQRCSAHTRGWARRRP